MSHNEIITSNVQSRRSADTSEFLRLCSDLRLCLLTFRPERASPLSRLAGMTSAATFNIRLDAWKVAAVALFQPNLISSSPDIDVSSRPFGFPTRPLQTERLMVPCETGLPASVSEDDIE